MLDDFSGIVNSLIDLYRSSVVDLSKLNSLPSFHSGIDHTVVRVWISWLLIERQRHQRPSHLDQRRDVQREI